MDEDMNLLPCPFCGGEARFETYGGTACAVVCQACRCGTPTVRLDDGALGHEIDRTAAVDVLALKEGRR